MCLLRTWVREVPKLLFPFLSSTVSSWTQSNFCASSLRKKKIVHYWKATKELLKSILAWHKQYRLGFKLRQKASIDSKMIGKSVWYYRWTWFFVWKPRTLVCVSSWAENERLCMLLTALAGIGRWTHHCSVRAHVAWAVEWKSHPGWPRGNLFTFA